MYLEGFGYFAVIIPEVKLTMGGSRIGPAREVESETGVDRFLVEFGSDLAVLEESFGCIGGVAE